jgi:hypothetical protein
MFGLAWNDWRLWLIIAALIVLLYIARPQLHRLIRSIFFGLSHVFRYVAHRLQRAGDNVYRRYIEIVAAHTAEDLEQKLVGQERRLEGRAPQIDRRMSAIVDSLETSRAELDETVETFRGIELDERTMDTVRESLESSRDSKTKTRYTAAASEVRRAVKEEIAPLRPQLNALRAELKPLGENTSRLRELSAELEQTSKKFNENLAQFEACIHPDYARRREAAQRHSILIPWVLALIVMTVALTGVFLNFFLIQRPMAEIVGDDLQVLGLPLPTAAALVVIFLEAVAGIVLMDAAGVTKLTQIATLPRLSKRTLLYAAIAFLTAFSVFEALLAIQREALIEIDQQTTRMALGEDAGDAGTHGLSLTMLAQMILAVLIPWLLAIAAIPLETVIQNLVFILRLVAHQLLIFASFIFALLANVMKALGLFLLRVYDLIIFLPLAIEQMVKKVTGKDGSRPSGEAA